MIKVVINADDFGYSNGVNYGIIHAFKQGVLTSTTCMTNTPGFNHAVQLANQNPKLGVGIHLVLTHGKPLLENVHSLIDLQGNFNPLSYYENSDFTINHDELYREWKAQIEKFLENGLTPTHLDSHHHIHSFGNNYEVFLKLAREYQLPVRNNFQHKVILNEVVTTDIFAGELSEEMFENQHFEETVKGINSIEIMCHPAYIDSHLLKSSSFVYPRLEELDFLCSSKLNEFFADKDTYILTTFDQI